MLGKSTINQLFYSTYSYSQEIVTQSVYVNWFSETGTVTREPWPKQFEDFKIVFMLLLYITLSDNQCKLTEFNLQNVSFFSQLPQEQIYNFMPKHLQEQTQSEVKKSHY